MLIMSVTDVSKARRLDMKLDSLTEIWWSRIRKDGLALG